MPRALTSYLLLAMTAAFALAACGGAGSAPSSMSSIAASPASLSQNLLGGSPQSFQIALTGTGLDGLQWSAPDLSFLSVSIGSVTATSAALNVELTSAGTTTISVHTANGASVQIPVTSVVCGRPDLMSYARLIFPADGAHAVPVNTSSYFIEVAGMAPASSPFEPALHAHFVVNNTSTVDPQPSLSPAVPPPGAATPNPAPTGAVGYEMGIMPQLSAATTYTVYVYDDSCQYPWNAGSFTTK